MITGLVTVSNGALQTLSDFNAYATQVVSAKPSLMTASAYTPKNTALQSCPKVGGSWNASSTLPPSPNNDLCNCAVSNATCVANSNVSPDGYGDLFSFICAAGACDGIIGDGSKGEYGAYSMCSAQQRLSIAMNAYFIMMGGDSQSCNFNGNAIMQTPSIAGSCGASLTQAGGALGTGTSTAGASGGSGSSSSAASASGLPSFDFGVLAVGVYTVVATALGAGLFLL